MNVTFMRRGRVAEEVWELVHPRIHAGRASVIKGLF